MVKKVGSYLLDTVIPKFVQDLCSLDVSPMDGQTLTDVLHSNGINVRYLGKVSLCALIHQNIALHFYVPKTIHFSGCRLDQAFATSVGLIFG